MKKGKRLKLKFVIPMIIILLLLLVRPCFSLLFTPDRIDYTFNGVTATLSEDEQNQIYELLHGRLFTMKHIQYLRMVKHGWTFPKYAEEEYLTIYTKFGFKYQIYIWDEFGTTLKISTTSSYHYLGFDGNELLNKVTDSVKERNNFSEADSIADQ